MILQSLCKYYDRLAANPDTGIARFGYTLNPVSSCVALNIDGDILDVLPLLDGKKFRQLNTPQHVKRSNNIAPGFLCDNAEYFFGTDPKHGQEKLGAARDFHRAIIGDVKDDGGTAILNFLEKVTGIPGKYAKTLGSKNIVFCLDGIPGYIHDRLAMRSAWEEYNLKSLQNSEVAQCLVTGEVAPIARLHGNFSGFGQDKPTLVCFNLESFKSYDLTRKDANGKNINGTNAPVSEVAMFKYTTALNALILSPQNSIDIDDRKIVFWAEEKASNEENFLRAFWLGGFKETQNLDELATQKINAALMSLREGKPTDIPDINVNIKFHILGMSASKTRLAIRFFNIDTFGNLFAGIGQHYHDIDIEGAAWDQKLITPYNILLEASRGKDYKERKQNIPPVLKDALLRSIIEGTSYPYTLCDAILARIRADKNINHVRAGILKGILNRDARHNNKKEMITLSLNKEETNLAYLLGRIFAVLEKAQRDALGGEINSTITDRYLNAAMTTPQTVFPVLFSLFEHHISKSRNYYPKSVLHEIFTKLPADTFPEILDTKDQCRFTVGYYHQRQNLYTKQEKEDKDSVKQTGIQETLNTDSPPSAADSVP
ncbi:type I-C CRISPR-associated protein Cas8c/Csd1 [Synergistales bacterium]|nr:type I-C CRISPR-associated protein Cas8c/Csd1 [Synergistales bacterium]